MGHVTSLEMKFPIIFRQLLTQYSNCLLLGCGLPVYLLF